MKTWLALRFMNRGHTNRPRPHCLYCWGIRHQKWLGIEPNYEWYIWQRAS